MAQYAEPITTCLYVSKDNQRKRDIAENWSAVWGMNLSSTIWRIVDEYDQMKKWSIYDHRRTEK